MLTNNLLSGTKIHLNAVTEEDIPTITNWYQNADFLRLLDAVAAMPRGYEETKKEFLQSSPNTFRFAIRENGSQQLLGIVQLQSILWTHGVTWVAIEIDPAHQNKGIGQEAMQLCLKFAFHELNMHRVQLTVFEYNSRAIATYEKLGFQQEGAYREFLFRDGKRYDMLLFGLLRPEWEAMQRD